MKETAMNTIILTLRSSDNNASLHNSLDRSGHWYINIVVVKD